MKLKHYLRKLTTAAVLILVVFMIGCKETDARKINKYLAEKKINIKIESKNREDAINDIYNMVFKNSYFSNNPKEAADFITKLEYYEVVSQLATKIINENGKRDGSIHDIYILCLINISLLIEKPIIAQTALETLNEIIQKLSFRMDNNPRMFYINLDGDIAGSSGIDANILAGFSAFVLDNDSPSSLKYYPNILKNAYDKYPYIKDLKSAPEELKNMILTSTFFEKGGGFKRVFPASERLFENFSPSSPKRGAYIFEFDDAFYQPNGKDYHFVQTFVNSVAVNSYKKGILYSVSNPNHASIIIKENYSYEYVGLYQIQRDLGHDFWQATGGKRDVYVRRTNVQVKDAVSGRILFNRTHKTKALNKYDVYNDNSKYELYYSFPIDEFREDIENIINSIK